MSSYSRNLCKPSDIQEHLGLLHGLAANVKDVVEFGFRTGVSASAFLAAGCKVRSYDVDKKCRPHVQRLAKEYPKTFSFKLESSLTANIPMCDILFIDSDHTEATTFVELKRHHRSLTSYGRIILHDTVSFGWKDRKPGKGKGILAGLEKFLKTEDRSGWKVILHLKNCNGLTILERMP